MLFKGFILVEVLLLTVKGGDAILYPFDCVFVFSCNF